MSDLPHLIRTRRSIRRYTSQPISEDVLINLCELANWSPSAHNRQPWRFAMITTPEMKKELAQAMGRRLHHDLTADNVPAAVIEKDVNRSFQRITGATALICLCLAMDDMDKYPDERRSTNEHIMAIQSVAMAGQTLMLAAHDVGLGACWMCAPLFCPDVVAEVLDLPESWEPQGLITLGYPAEERHRDREPVEGWMLWR